MTSIDRASEPYGVGETGNLESSMSAISWGAIIGGAVAAVAVSLFLVSLGAALGLASASPWSNEGASLTTIGVGAAIWLVVTQWLSSAFGGYLTGRLRTKWAAMHSDEVLFRDTAHGFLAWGLSTVVALVIVVSIAGGGANMAATVASGAAQGATQAAASEGVGPFSYSVDSLFRSATPGQISASSGALDDFRGESERILARAMTTDLAPADRTYLGQLVAARTGLAQPEAEKRVDEVIAAAKQDAEAARKAAAAVAFLTALSLVVGAFVAAAAGGLGGRHRDEI